MATSRVGVRELRQNLSVHLQRVRAGDRLEVTERGRPVAALVPIERPASALSRLVAAGRASEPAGDVLQLGPPRGRTSRRLSDALEAARSEES